MFARTTRRTAILTLIAGLGATAGALAQPRPQLVAPPPGGWRPPALVVAGAEQPVRLQSLRIDVEVAAGVAETRVQMEFFNPNTRVLEGKLQFPLGAGQVVSGFALDIDGQMRDAVPVEKARAEQVFEDITRRRIDPGLLQTTLGNNYELRVYPLSPGKSRTVVLTLVEAAPARLVLPLAYAASVPRFDLSLRYAGAQLQPRGRKRQPARACASSAIRAAASAPAARSPTRPCRARACASTRRPRTATRSRSRPRSATARPSSPSPCRWPSAARRGRCRAACRSSGTPRARARSASSIASRPCSTPTSAAPATAR